MLLKQIESRLVPFSVLLPCGRLYILISIFVSSRAEHNSCADSCVV